MIFSSLFRPRRGTGWLPDEPDSRDQPLDLMGLGDTPPASASLLRFCPIALNQGRTESCVGHAVALGLLVAHRAAGNGAVPMPSRRFIYWHARGYHSAELIDAGTNIRNAVKGVVRFGPSDETACPWDVKRINVSPGFGAYRAAFDGAGLRGYYRITSTGNDRLVDVRRAIASGVPVVFGTGVSQSFKDFSGSLSQTVTRPSVGNIVGRHAMAIVGYEGSRYLLQNSWSQYWGEAGRAWIDGAYLAWDETRDIWALDCREAP